MPITSTPTVSYTLVRVNVDMNNMTTSCYFARTIGGVSAGGIEMLLEGAEMGQLLMTQAQLGQTLGNEITDTIYNMAVAKGVLEGVIS